MFRVDRALTLKLHHQLEGRGLSGVDMPSLSLLKAGKAVPQIPQRAAL